MYSVIKNGIVYYSCFYRKQAQEWIDKHGDPKIKYLIIKQ